MDFTQANIEKWLAEMVEKSPLTCANAEKFNIMCEAMRNMAHMHRTFTEEDAREWAKHMDPPARWAMDQTTSVMQQYGYHHKPCEFWVVMNMLFSDYGKTLAKYNLDKPEVWASLANDFISDSDAAKDKVARYWRDIVEH